MASLSTDGRGNRTVQFQLDPGGKRRSIRLGKLNAKHAEAVRVRVAHVVGARRAGMPLDPETASWLKSLAEGMYDKLAAAELVPRRQSGRLAEFLAGYVERRAGGGAKKSSLVNLRRVSRTLVALFGAGRDLRDITPKMADDWVRGRVQVNAGETVARDLRFCRTFFSDALRHGLVESNPFAKCKGPAGGPDPDRQCYVTRQTAHEVIDSVPPDWQVVVALSRFAGLRAPTEVVTLRGADVDLAAGRMTVRSPKTEHHKGKGVREVPIHADLKPHLAAALERAEGSVYVVNGVGARVRAAVEDSPNGWCAASLGTLFNKVFAGVGIDTWPKPFNNMRASCATDYVDAGIPEHTVCKWMGHSKAVARRNYLQVTDRDFESVAALPATALSRDGGPDGSADSGASGVQKPVQPPTAADCQGRTEPPRTAAIGGILATSGGRCPTVAVDHESPTGCT